MLAEALKAPARSSDAVPTMVVGGFLIALSLLFPGVVVVIALQETPLALAALPVTVFPALVFAGYALRVAAAGAREDPAVPSFVDWGGLIRGGVGSTVVTGWYLLPLVVVGVAWVATVVGFSTDVGTLPRSELAQSASTLATLGFGGVYLLVFAYLWPAAMATYGVSGRLRSALDPRTVVRVGVSRRYLVGWLAAGLVTVFVGVPTAALSLVLLGLPLLFYVLAATSSLVGRASGRQLRAGLSEAVRPDHDTIPDPEPEATVQAGRSVGADATGLADADPATAVGTGDRPDPGADATGAAPERSTSAAANGEAAADRGTPAEQPATATGGATGPGAAAGNGDDGPETLDGYELADGEAGGDRLVDPDDALAAFDPSDAADDADADDLGSTPLASDDGDDGDDDEGFQWGRVDDGAAGGD
jgi:uncharacterized membrane protein YccF (DUF307 family)